MNSFLLTIVTVFVLLVQINCQFLNPWGLNGQSYNSMGNVYYGSPDAGIYLLCNGIGCPARG